jgi:hypothetical protein
MARVALFFFTMYDINADKIVRSRRPATLDAIRKFGGTPIMETEQHLDSSKVDDDGLLKIDLYENRVGAGAGTAGSARRQRPS